MTNDEMAKTWIPHLRGQFERARPILFTGAGFSLESRNVQGEPLPTPAGLRRKLWELCFPGTPIEDGNSLQDLYEHSLLRHRKNLSEILLRELTVDAESIPEWYGEIFSMSWQRIYTLNIDDLPTATSRKYYLPRKIISVSATNPSAHESAGNPAHAVEVVYLNGNLEDVPDHITFSVTQYAERLARPDPWYMRFSADLLTSPVVFIGTRLDESPLWQHLTMRQGGGGREMRELRHRSYLVTPSLDRARGALLAEFNVVWIPMTAEGFAKNVLSQLKDASANGLTFLATRPLGEEGRAQRIAEVAELAHDPSKQNQFLLGEEPVWADLQSGRAIEREIDAEIAKSVAHTIAEDIPTVIVVTGTAGSGKSTSMMRECLKLSGDGVRVGWIDRETELTPGNIRAGMRSDDAPPVLAIDDADMYGTELPSLVRDVVLRKPRPLVILGLRSGRVDHALNPVIMEGIRKIELAMPPLADTDISDLIDLLEREKRLGILTGKPRNEQVTAFRDQAGRQLLVAMLQATSGRRFEEKAFEELGELQADAQLVYAIVALASSYRFGLGKDELLIATGNKSNIALNSIEQLISRHVITVRPDGQIWARHRVIAEIIRDELAKRGQLTLPISGLALLAASKVSVSLSRSARPWRLLRIFINHDFLLRHGGTDFARNLYGTLEDPLAWDYHFWLQRGSLEVEFGDLKLAEHYLNTSRALAPDDPYIDNEYAYLLFRKAIENPTAGEAERLVKEATDSLEYLMSKIATPYPYHVLGSQGLAWARRGIQSPDERGKYLRTLQRRLEEGSAKYPKEIELKQLLDAVKKEYLSIAVPQRAF
jgi:hypothetical protein